MGSSIPSRQSTSQCSQLLVKIIINDLHESTRYLHILGSNSEFRDSYSRESATYNTALKIAEQCISLLTIILRRNQEKKLSPSSFPDDTNTANNDNKNIIDNIKKLAELKELGIITEAEFESKKKELIDRL